MAIPPFIPAKPRRRRKRKLVVQPMPAPPVGLTLVSAVYEDDVLLKLTLSFDREIDISGYVAASMQVNDGATSGALYLTGDAKQTDDQTVLFGLDYLQTATDPGVWLTAPDSTGIVAVDDGGTWAGCSEVVLPFGS